MDIHEIKGVSAEDLARAHAADVKIQGRYGVEYHKYWFNKEKGKAFCICSAPDRESAALVHRNSHGLEASKIIEVDPDVVDGFLGDASVDPAGAVVAPAGEGGDHDPGIRTIMFTDIVGSTEITQRLGDDAAMAMVNAHDTIVRGALGAWRGREIKHTGDGIMACFVSPAASVRCATQIQQDMKTQCETCPEMPVRVRIGLASGEPVEQNQDLFGSTVQLAARLCASAQPDQCLASNVLAELCMGKGLKFSDQGELSLKGFAQPVHVHAIQFS
jgi:class 3 adenylate cyclase